MVATPATSVGGFLGMYLILIGEKDTLFQVECRTQMLMLVACRVSASNGGGEGASSGPVDDKRPGQARNQSERELTTKFGPAVGMYRALMAGGCLVQLKVSVWASWKLL